MNHDKKLYLILFVLCILAISACTRWPFAEPTATPPIIVPPTIDVPVAAAPTETVPVATAEPTATTELAPVVTTVATAVTAANPTPTTAPNIVPTAGATDCVRPDAPEGAAYITYAIVAGDTLFSIGQRARPSMTVNEIAAANCLVDVNRIEVGQQLLIWHSPTTGPVTQTLLFEPSMAGPLATYTGPLVSSEQAFIFDGVAGQNFDIISGSGRSPLLLFTLEKADGSAVVGTVSTTERFYLFPESRGRQFVLPSDGTYRVRVQGNPGVALDLTFVLGAPNYMVLGAPQRIQFPAGGTSATVTGTSVDGTLDRFVFGAAAGQQLELNVIREFNVEVWIEDSSENILFRTDGVKQGQLTLPVTGDYILTVFHGGSEVYLYGDYEFNLSITTPVTAATPAPAGTPGVADFVTLTFSEGINGWLFANDSGILGDQGKKTFSFYVGGERNLTLIDRADSTLNFVLEKGDGTVQVGSVSTAERHFLDPLSRGRDFLLPQTAEYHLHVTGIPGAPYDLGLVWGASPHPVLGTPERVQFAAGTVSAQISGTTAPGTMDRYVFRALAGQTVTLAFNQPADVIGANAWLETSSEQVILKTATERFKSVVLPMTDDYIITIIHPAGEVYGSGPYNLTLTIE